MRKFLGFLVNVVIFLSLISLAACTDAASSNDGGASGNAGAAGAAGMAGASGASGMAGASGEGGGGIAGMDGSDRDAICAALCERVEPLACPGETMPCLSQCNAFYDSPQCQDELRALLHCGAEASPADWQCNEGTGEAETKPGFCDEELATAMTCIAG